VAEGSNWFWPSALQVGPAVVIIESDVVVDSQRSSCVLYGVLARWEIAWRLGLR